MPCTIDNAWQWHDSQPWLCGFNYVPSTAGNSTQMWEGGSFDLPTMERELSWAQDIGLNACRVFLPYIVWRADSEGLLDRLDRFLHTAAGRGIKTLPVLFDDCAFGGMQPRLGDRGRPTPGVHNSLWTPSPGHAIVADRQAWPGLKAYVTELLWQFGQDERVLAWDLYNEPGNSGMGDMSRPLLMEVFEWARTAMPQQPITAGVWNRELTELNEVMLAGSDIVSFHNYGDAADLTRQIDELAVTNRPLLCTEWLARPASMVASHLPIFKQRRVGCFLWSLVNGLTQTQFPWNSPPGSPPPEVWFQDLLRPDGRPFDADEVEIIKQALAQK